MLLVRLIDKSRFFQLANFFSPVFLTFSALMMKNYCLPLRFDFLFLLSQRFFSSLKSRLIQKLVLSSIFKVLI